MSNTNLTADVIVKAGAALFKNNTPFIQGIDRQYDRSYEVAGAKQGDTIRILRPQQYTTRTGKTANVQNRVEESVSLAVSSQIGIDLRFSSAELAQDIEPFTRKNLMAPMATLTSTIENTIMQSAYQGTNQSVGTPGTDPASWLVYGNAGAKLDNGGAMDDMRRSVVLNPAGRAATVDGLKGLFNPQDQLRSQFIRGRMGETAGFSFASTPNVARHTTGAFAGTVLVDDASIAAGDTTIGMDAFTDSAPTVKKGDVFTMAGVNSVNPISKADTGQLAQFVVTADATGSGNEITSVAFFPALQSTGPLQNITALPADDAAVTFVGTASTGYAQNLAYHERAYTFATADLPLYGATDFESRTVLDGVSIRLMKVVDGVNDDCLYRFDVLYGFKTVIHEWATRIQGA